MLTTTIPVTVSGLQSVNIVLAVGGVPALNASIPGDSLLNFAPDVMVYYHDSGSAMDLISRFMQGVYNPNQDSSDMAITLVGPISVPPLKFVEEITSGINLLIPSMIDMTQMRTNATRMLNDVKNVAKSLGLRV
jgi:hypothetical protein